MCPPRFWMWRSPKAHPSGSWCGTCCFPVAQANIWDHLRGVYGVGWGWIIMAEVVVRPEYGLGALIGVSERRSHTDAIFAVIIVIVLIAVACDQLWRLGGDCSFPTARHK